MFYCCFFLGKSNFFIFILDFRINVMLEMFFDNQLLIGYQSFNLIFSNSIVQIQLQSELGLSLYGIQYYGVEVWWSMGEFFYQGFIYQSVGLFIYGKNDDDIWDLSDSIVDLYMEVSEREEQERDKFMGQLRELKIEVDRKWLEKDISNGFVRVFQSDSEVFKVFFCILLIFVYKFCLQCGRFLNFMYIQLNGDIIWRLELFDCLLVIQNEYFQNVGYKDIKKIQQMGLCFDFFWFVKFYVGKMMIQFVRLFDRCL